MKVTLHHPIASLVVLRLIVYASEPDPLVVLPGSIEVYRGGNAHFEAGWSKRPDQQYQWYRNGQALPGANGGSLDLTNLTAVDFGDYFVEEVGGRKSKPVRMTELMPGTPGSGDLSFKSPQRSLYSWPRLALDQQGRIFTTASCALRRLLSDGTPDPSWPSVCLQDYATTISVLSNGAILLGGMFEQIAFNGRPLLDAPVVEGFARLNPDGTLDENFTLNFVYGNNLDWYSSPSVTRVFAVQGDKYLVSGFWGVKNSPLSHIVLIRLLSNGFLDPTFAPLISSASPDSGTGITPFITKIIPLPSGGILVTGEFENLNGSSITGVARLNSNGSVNPDFHSPFPVTLNQTAFSAGVLDAELLPDGGYLVLPSGNYGPMRLRPDGKIEPTFQVLQINGWGPRRILLQPDGKVLLGGSFGGFDEQFWGSESRVFSHLIRLMADGTWDPSFVPLTSSPEVDGDVSDMLLTPYGKLLVSGRFLTADGFPAADLVRLHLEQSVPSLHHLTVADFADGRITLEFNPGDGNAYELQQSVDGSRWTTVLSGTSRGTLVQYVTASNPSEKTFFYRFLSNSSP